MDRICARIWVISDHCSFGDQIRAGLRHRIGNSSHSRVASLANESEGWFYPPGSWSRINARALPYAENEGLNRYAVAYPCLAVPVCDVEGVAIGYKFVCLAMALWNMKKAWIAHPSRIAFARPDARGSDELLIDLSVERNALGRRM